MVRLSMLLVTVTVAVPLSAWLNTVRVRPDVRRGLPLRIGRQNHGASTLAMMVAVAVDIPPTVALLLHLLSRLTLSL